jgi:branched-chain amino acid transport system permease protein
VAGRLPRLRDDRLRAAVTGWGLLALVLAVTSAAVSVAGTSQLERTYTDFLLVATLVVGLQTFVGNSGIVSFGHVAFVGVGAYVTALVTIPSALRTDVLPSPPGWIPDVELGLLPAVLVSALVAAALAALVGGAMARMSEMGFAMATLALLVLVHAVLANWDSVTRGGYGIFGIPANTTLWLALAGLVGVMLVARLYRASRAGLRLQATREDPVPSASVGINVAAARFTGWVISAALMGAGGSLLAQQLLAFDPDQFFFALTFSTLAMLVIGGRESVTGALVGAALVVVASDYLRGLERGFSLGPIDVPELTGLVQLVVAVLIVLVLILRPAGIVGRFELDELIPGRLRRPRGGAAAFREAAEGARRPTPVTREALGEGETLALERVVMAFQGVRALGGVSLTVTPGEIVGLIGPNGSGKTTLLNVASGLYRPTSGTVRLDGRDVTGWPPHRIANLGLARTFQNIRLFGGLTVRENLLASAPRGEASAEVDDLLELFELSEHAETRADALSYGAQRRVEAARATIRRPSILLLDEPAAGMNEAESEGLLETITQVRDALGCGVVVIDHDLRLILRLCERVHVLNEGETIAEGPPDAVANDPRVIEAYLGTSRATTPNTTAS